MHIIMLATALVCGRLVAKDTVLDLPDSEAAPVVDAGHADIWTPPELPLVANARAGAPAPDPERVGFTEDQMKGAVTNALEDATTKAAADKEAALAELRERLEAEHAEAVLAARAEGKAEAEAALRGAGAGGA